MKKIINISILVIVLAIALWAVLNYNDINKYIVDRKSNSLLEKTQDLISEKKYDEALVPLYKLEKIWSNKDLNDPDYRWLMFFIGNCLIQSGDDKKGELYYEKVLKFYEDNIGINDLIFNRICDYYKNFNSGAIQGHPLGGPVSRDCITGDSGAVEKP